MKAAKKQILEHVHLTMLQIPTIWCPHCKMDIPYNAWRKVKEEGIEVHQCPLCENRVG